MNIFNSEKKRPRILVIITGGNRNRTKGAKYLSDALKNNKADFDFVDPSQIMLEVANTIGHDKIYIRSEGKSDSEYGRLYSTTYDGVIVRASRGINYVSNVLRHFENNVGVYCTASGDGIIEASRKFITHQKISSKGVRTPKTVLFSSPKDFKFLTDLVGGVGNGNSVVCKTSVGGSQGVGTMILETPLAASTMLETFSKKKIPLILQEFIETADKDSEKFDTRFIVVGDKVVCAMKRYSLKGDFRSNYSKSKSALSYTPTKEQIRLAVESSKALRLDFAGVDIAVNVKDQKDYVIEVNSNPGTGIIGICNYNFFDDLVKLVISKSKKNKTVKVDNYKSYFTNDYEFNDYGFSDYDLYSDDEVIEPISKVDALNMLQNELMTLKDKQINCLNKLTKLSLQESMKPENKELSNISKRLSDKIEVLQIDIAKLKHE